MANTLKQQKEKEIQKLGKEIDAVNKKMQNDIEDVKKKYDQIVDLLYEKLAKVIKELKNL